MNDKIEHALNINEHESFPVSVTTQEAYKKLAKLLSKKKYPPRDMAFVFACGVVAALAGYYNYAFGKAYVHDVSTRWGFSPEEADMFGTFCGTIGLIINTAINGKSIHQAFHIVKDEIIKKSFGKKEQMPDDNFIKIALGIMGVLSVIGALPNLKFVYDTSKDGSKAYLFFMEAIQFITMSALNMRGLYNTVKIQSERKQVVQKFKLEMLKDLNECLIEAKRLGHDDLTALSQGVLIRKKLPILRKPLKAVTGLYVGGYSAAFYFAVKKAIDIPADNGVFDDIMNFGVTGCGLLSSALKWFLLGNAYAGLVDRIFNLFQEPLLKINQNEVRSQYISRNTDRILAVVGLLVAIFSLGSASKVVEKYFFDDQDKTAETFFMSLFIGGGAALGINAMDLSTIIERIIDFGGHIFKTKIRPSKDPLEYLGKSHDEMMLKLMMEIATMNDSVFLEKYLNEFNSGQMDQIMSQMYTSSGNKNAKAPTLYMHGYIPNDAYQEFMVGTQKLKENANNSDFVAFKNVACEDDVESQLQEFIDQAPLLLKGGVLK